jgi:GntR family transcriptional regulator, gluconate operon transcriptional repressor
VRSDRIVREELWRQVARRLRQDISRGRLPPGARLIEVDLAERFGVSRGPIREAIRELARSGLVVTRHHQGVFVSTPSDADLDEIFVFREAIEVAAGKVALTKVVRGDIDRLRNLLDAMEGARAKGDSASGTSLDLKFHREIFVIAGGARLLGAQDDLLAQMLLSASINKTMNHDIYPPSALHRAILDAMAAGDEEALVMAIEAHYEWSGDRLLGRHPIEGSAGARRRSTRLGERSAPVAVAE